MRKDLFRHKILFLALAVSILFVLWLQSASFVRLGLAGYFYDKQDYMKAASCYGKIIRKISKNPSAIPESALYGFTQCYLKQAEYYYARGEYKKVANLALDWDEALALYGVKDLKIIPKWYDLADTTYQLLADKYLNEGKFDDAVKMCTYFIKYSPDNRKAYVLLLDIYKKSEKWSLFLQASRDYAEKFKAEPDFGISNSRQAIGLSIAYLHEGNQDKAMYWADRSLEIADNIQQGLGILNNVLLYEHTEAFLHFNIARFLILEKDYKNAYRSLAEAMRFSGKDSVIWKKSEDAAFALMRLEPPDIDVFIRLGYAYEGKEYYKKAVWAFRCARKISRNNLMVLQNLKHIYVESRKDNMQLNLIQASIDKALEGIAPIDVFVNGSHENIFPIKIYEAEDMPRVTGEKIQDARASGNFAV
ncbi:MAG: hypothetical protein JW946_02480, partial [Candidatus Omnitrophica bacterium]|nr:hypothetical protein [Candidatus Omnitrophota bacterium]